MIKALQPLLERTSWIVGCAVICASCQSPLGAESPSVEDQVIEARLDTSYHDLGVRPDCTEEAISYQELLELAQSVNPDIPDPQQAFLDALPAGALQTFTLVFDSESAQSRGISSEWPGIIRMTQDGQLTIRYTCDRSVSSTYGKVEVIHFDPVTQRFGFTELNLMSSDRVKQEPLQCYGCHNIDRSTEDARPNWNMYPNWKGFFGSHDDFFPQGTPEEASLVGHAPDWLPPNHSEEKDRYQQFIQAHVITNPDPCYMSLPWPTPWRVGGVTPERFTQYPYGTQSGNARQRLYALRPNLKLTEIYSKRLAQRNFRRLRQHPQYEEVKVLLALEAASCDQRSLHPELDQRQNAQVSQEWLDTRIATLLPNYTRAAGEQPRAIGAEDTSVDAEIQ